jgi:Cu+-exporting ATPase
MSNNPELTQTVAADPACGMAVNVTAAKHQLPHAGTTYYFCSVDCAEKFRAEPQKFLNKMSTMGTAQLPGVDSAATLKAGPSVPTPATSHAKDPVCGMDVDPSTAQHRLEHGGTTYYFCSGHCLEKFKAHPEQYLSVTAPTASDGAQATHVPSIPPAKTVRDRTKESTSARCVRRCARLGPARARTAACHWNP